MVITSSLQEDAMYCDMLGGVCYKLPPMEPASVEGVTAALAFVVVGTLIWAGFTWAYLRLWKQK